MNETYQQTPRSCKILTKVRSRSIVSTWLTGAENKTTQSFISQRQLQPSTRSMLIYTVAVWATRCKHMRMPVVHNQQKHLFRIGAVKTIIQDLWQLRINTALAVSSVVIPWIVILVIKLIKMYHFRQVKEINLLEIELRLSITSSEMQKLYKIGQEKLQLNLRFTEVMKAICQRLLNHEKLKA